MPLLRRSPLAAPFACATLVVSALGAADAAAPQHKGAAQRSFPGLGHTHGEGRSFVFVPANHDVPR